MRRDFLKTMGLGGAAASFQPAGSATLQEAIDRCARSGGGTVRIPPGRHVTGTLVLRSRVRLHLEAGAVLAGSKNLQDYPPKVPKMRSYVDSYTEKSLIYAEDAEDIAIEGRGTIDGQGAVFEGPYKVRPYTVRFIGCRRVAVEGVRFVDSPMWVQHYLACDDVTIRGITVASRVNHNNDGIDIDCCRNVRISDCEIFSGDDAIVLKSTADRVCRDVAISNCTLSSLCNALKLGTETNGGFENIAISNCTIRDTGLAGLALEMVDGGTLDRVAVTNLVMQNVGAPVFLRLGNRARPFTEGGPRPGMGRMRNVTISNLEATGCGRVGCALSGLAGHAIENVTLANLRLAFAGGGSAADAAREIPEHPEKYPEFGMFGVLPAYGLYCRHMTGLELRGVKTSFGGSEARPALVCEDVAGLALDGFEGAAAGGPAVRLVGVRDAFVHGCRAVSEAPAWLEVSGAATRHVTLAANQLWRARKAVAVAPEVPPGAVTGA